jgi:CheY-like chemotaxis protein
LAEDNIVNQRVAIKQLARLGYAADVVSSGVQVMEALARASYDIILMDCHMPEMDGYEAARRIRALPNSLGKLRIVALTANAMHGDREKCIEAGMDDYLSKPVKLEELRVVMERNSELAAVD